VDTNLLDRPNRHRTHDPRAIRSRQDDPPTQSGRYLSLSSTASSGQLRKAGEEQPPFEVFLLQLPQDHARKEYRSLNQFGNHTEIRNELFLKFLGQLLIHLLREPESAHA